MMPMSFVAALTPSREPEEPVLCATTVPAGSRPFNRVGKVFVAVIQPRRSPRLAGLSPRPRCSADSQAAAATGVAQLRYCAWSSRPISPSVVSIRIPSTPRLER
jgi:hypothetical protein